MGMPHIIIRRIAALLTSATLAGCSPTPPEPTTAEAGSARRDADRVPVSAAEPPPEIRAWMDRLTVDHEYDPESGFIVAREVISLPPVIASGPDLAEAIETGRSESRPVVVFATADRCAPCQQYKKSALNDPGVIKALNRSDVLVTHIEVDREPERAESILGSRAIPMTYLFRDGQPVSTLRGQRSAAELLAWLDETL